jgi:hypothetical protein
MAWHEHDAWGQDFEGLVRARDRRGSAVVCVSAAQVRINHSTFHAGLHRLEL